MSRLIEHHTDEVTLSVPRAWPLIRAPDRGVLLHAWSERVGISLLRPVPPRGPTGWVLGTAMTLWEDVEVDPIRGVTHRVLTITHCGVERVRQEWEWEAERAVLLRCSCPADEFDGTADLFAQVADSVLLRVPSADGQPTGPLPGTIR